MRRRILIIGWLLVLVLSSLLPLSAVLRGVVALGPSNVVAEGTLDRPVIALGGSVVLPHGARSIVVVVMGDIELHGRARDDLVIVGGNVYLAPHSSVGGDVVSVLGGTYQSRSATVHGRIGGALHDWKGSGRARPMSLAAAAKNSMRLGLAAGLALLLVCTVLAIVFPWQVVLISTTLREAPVKSTVAGALSLVTFVFLVVPLGLSLVGLPFAVLLTGAASLAWLFGITAAAVVLGRRVSRRPVSLVWATAAGLLLLALGMAVPVFGPLFVTAVGLAGAGALAVALLGRARPSLPMP